MRNYSHCLALGNPDNEAQRFSSGGCDLLTMLHFIQIFWWQTSCRSRARPGHTEYSPAQLVDTSSARFTVRCQPSNYTGRRWRGGATMKQQRCACCAPKQGVCRSVYTWDGNAMERLGLGRYWMLKFQVVFRMRWCSKFGVTSLSFPLLHLSLLSVHRPHHSIRSWERLVSRGCSWEFCTVVLLEKNLEKAMVSLVA